MLRTRLLRRPLAGAVICLAAVPAAAAAKPRTHVFKMDMTVHVSTEWDSWSKNTVCSDLTRTLTGSGAQVLTMRAKKRLVTFRKGRLAFPGTKGTETMSLGPLGRVTFFPLKGTVVRRAAYELTKGGAGRSCAPGWTGGQPPSTATCGTRTAKGGQYALVPRGGNLHVMSLTLLDPAFAWECPAESNAALTLPQPLPITHGKGALRKLANPRVKKVVVEAAAYDLETDEDWGMGEEHGGLQTTDAHWYVTLRRVKG